MRIVLLMLICALPAQETKVVRMIAERFVFVPSQVKVKKGTVVEFRITSEDTNHGFHIPKAGINVIIPKRGRGEAKVVFRAEEPGEYAFECSKACGAGHTQMRGVLVVE
ncbi:MAG: cupredoxin domain-containing protein [Bryobacteraceae bacterium]